jgi:hypothetical protein
LNELLQPKFSRGNLSSEDKWSSVLKIKFRQNQPRHGLDYSLIVVSFSYDSLILVASTKKYCLQFLKGKNLYLKTPEVPDQKLNLDKANPATTFTIFYSVVCLSYHSLIFSVSTKKYCRQFLKHLKIPEVPDQKLNSDRDNPFTAFKCFLIDVSLSYHSLSLSGSSKKILSSISQGKTYHLKTPEVPN